MIKPKLQLYLSKINRWLPRKRTAKIQVVTFFVISLLALTLVPVVFVLNRSDVDIRQQAYTDPATGESCGWCAGPDQCFASTGHAPEAGSSAACAGGACCTGFSAGGGGGGNTGGGGGGTGGGTAPATAKGVGANCVLGGSADPPEGCDGAGPLICAYCNDAMNKAGQSVCSFTEDGGTQHIAACGGLKGQTGSGPAVCTVGSRSECGIDGCVGNQQRLCDAFGQWGPCVNATQCGYTGATNGVACSQNLHCQSGFCNPSTNTCSDPQPSCYTAADECLSHNPQNCDDAQSFSTYTACSVAVAPGCYVTSDQCQSDNPQNCEDSRAYQSQAACQAALDAGEGGVAARCYVESNGCDNQTLANCQADDSHPTYEACTSAISSSGGGTTVPTLASCSLSCGNASGCQCPSGCQRTFAQVGQACGSTATSGGGTTVPTLSSCTQSCGGANGCNCPTNCANTFVQVGQQCGALTQPTTPTGGSSQPQYGTATSCTQVCSTQDGCNCPASLNCQNSFAQFGTVCGQKTSTGGVEASLIPDNIAEQNGTQTIQPTPTPTPTSTQLAQNLGQAGGSQPTVQPTATPRITTSPTSGLDLTAAPSLPPSQTATPTQDDQSLAAPTTSGTSLGNILQPTTSPTSQLQALLNNQTAAPSGDQIGPVVRPSVRPSVQPLQAGLTATPVQTEEAGSDQVTTTETTTTSPFDQVRNAVANTGLGRFLGITPADESGDDQSLATTSTAIPDQVVKLQEDIFDLEFQIYAQREACLTDFALDQFRDPQLRRFCEPDDLKAQLSQRIADDPLCQESQEACQQVQDELQARARVAYIAEANESKASYLTRSCGAGGEDPSAIDFNCIKQVEDEVVALENEISAAMDEYCQDKEDEAACQDIRTEITGAVAIRVQEEIDYENTEQNLLTAMVGEETVKSELKDCDTLFTLGVTNQTEYQACIDRWTLDARIDNVQTVIDQARTGSCYNQDICQSEAELITLVEIKLEELDTVLDFNAQLVINEQTLKSSLLEMQALGCYRNPTLDQCLELQAIVDQTSSDIRRAEAQANTCGTSPSTGGLQASIYYNPYDGLSNASCIDLVSFSDNKSGTVDEFLNVYQNESEIDAAAGRWLQAETFLNLNCFRDEVVSQVACDQAEDQLAQAKADFLSLSGSLEACTDPNTENDIDSCQHLLDLYTRVNTELDETSVALNELSGHISGHVNGRFVLDSMIDAATNYNSRSFYCVTNDYCLVVEPDGAGGYSSRAVTFDNLVAEFNLSPIRQDQLLGQTAFTQATDEEFDPNNSNHVMAFGQVVYHQWYQDDVRPADLCIEQNRADAGTNLNCSNFAAGTGLFYSIGDDQYLKSCTEVGCEWVRISTEGTRDDQSILRRAAEITIFDQGHQNYDPSSHRSYQSWQDIQGECDALPSSDSRKVEYCYEADLLYRQIRDDLVDDFLAEQSLTVNDAANVLFQNDPLLSDEQKNSIGSYAEDFGGISYLGPDDLADPNYLYDRVQFNINLGVRTDLLEQALQTGCNDSGHTFDEEAGVIYVSTGSNPGTCAIGITIGASSIFSRTGIGGAAGVTQGAIRTRTYFDQSVGAFLEGDIAAGTERGLQGIYSGLDTARPVVALAGGPFGMVAAIADYNFAGVQTAALFADEGSLGDRALAGIKTVGSLTGGLARPVESFFNETAIGQTLGGVVNFSFSTIIGDDQRAAESLFTAVSHSQDIDLADAIYSGGLGLQTAIQGLSAVGLPNQVVRQGASKVFFQEFVVEENLESIAGNFAGSVGRQYDLGQGGVCGSGDICYGQVGQLYGNLFGGLVGGDIEQISNIDFGGSTNVTSFGFNTNLQTDSSILTNVSRPSISGTTSFLANNQTIGANTVFSPILQVDGGSVTINNAPIAVNTVAFDGSDTVLTANVNRPGSTSNVGGGISGVANAVLNAPTTTITTANSGLQTAVTNANALINQLFGGSQLVPAQVAVTSNNQTQRIGGPQNINNQTAFFDLDVFNPDSSRFDPGLSGIVPTRASTADVLNITQPGSVNQPSQVGNLNFPSDPNSVVDPDVSSPQNPSQTDQAVQSAVDEARARIDRMKQVSSNIDDIFTLEITGKDISPVDTVSPSLRQSLSDDFSNPNLARADFYTVALDQIQRTDPYVAPTSTEPTLNDQLTQIVTAINNSNTPVDTRTSTTSEPTADTTPLDIDDTNPFAEEDTSPFVDDDATESLPDQTANEITVPDQPTGDTTLTSPPTQLIADVTQTDTTSTESETGGPSSPIVVQLVELSPFEQREAFDKILAERGILIPPPIFPPASQPTVVDSSLDTTPQADAIVSTDTNTPNNDIDTQSDQDTQLTTTLSPTSTILRRPQELDNLIEDTGPLVLTEQDRNDALERSQHKRPPGFDTAISQAETSLSAPTELLTPPDIEVVTEPETIATPDSFIARVFRRSYRAQNMRILNEAHRQASELARLHNDNTFALRASNFLPVRIVSNLTLHLYAAFSGLSVQELAENFWSIELNNGAYKSTRTANKQLTSGQGNFDDVIAVQFNNDVDFNNTPDQAVVIAADISSFFKQLTTKIMPRNDFEFFSASTQVTFAVVQADGSIYIYQMSKQDVLSLDVSQLTDAVQATLNGQPATVIPANIANQLNQQILSGALHYGKPITAANVTPGNFITRRFNRPLVDQSGIDLLNQVQTMYNFNSQFILTKDINTTRVLPTAHHALHFSPNIPGTTNAYNVSMQFNHGITNGVSAFDDFFVGAVDTIVNQNIGQTLPEFHIVNNPDSNTVAARVRMSPESFAQFEATRAEIKSRAREVGLDFGRFGKHDLIHRALIRAISRVTGQKYSGHFLSAINNVTEYIAPSIIVIGDVNTEAEALQASSQEKGRSFEGRGLVSMYGAISQSIQNRAFFRNLLNFVGNFTFGPQTNLVTKGRTVMISIIPGLEGQSVGFSTAQSDTYENGVVIGVVDNIANNGTIELRIDIGQNVSVEEAAAIRNFFANLNDTQLQQMIQNELSLVSESIEQYQARGN